jgi:hypothetical protein
MIRKFTFLAALALGASTATCAAPISDQGQGQGGQTDRAPVVNVVVTFSGSTRVDGTSAPTAAPSATSSASAEQKATNDIKPNVEIPASAIPTIGAAGTIIPPVVVPATPEPPR